MERIPRDDYKDVIRADKRTEEYIHIRDAICTVENANVGRLTILPVTFVDSPGHMHEYAQYAMTYIDHIGRSDLFIIVMCNPKWIETVQLLLLDQTSSDQHDITERVFRQNIR